nr:PepSY domain-containing protein [uncultured Psychroserpens sp.]
MTISIWRFSHLILALISSIFIVLASVTGMILAFEPISNQLQPYGFDTDITVSKTIKNLTNRYDEIITIETDENDFIIASVITKEGESDTFYINPNTGEKVGALIEKDPIFSFATNLHRSLFLKSTGRFIVGFVSFLLILMALSGVVLIIKRQGGLHRYFSKVVNENVQQYYHVILGRWLLIPILIIALTGVYLSLEKFSLLPETKIHHNYSNNFSSEIAHTSTSDFEIFNTLKISEIKRLEFPFSDDIEDYFFVTLKDKELLINQYTGAIVSEQEYPLVKIMSQLSLFLHTGQGSVLWSAVLFFVCLALLFFIYSGFAMTLKRTKKRGIAKNKFSKDVSEIIILVGSETGSTINFANLFFDALIAQGKKAYIAEMNKYSIFKNAKQVVVFTSTYGEGDAPINAKKFKHLVKGIKQTQIINYTVVGFGSMLYPEYCKYAEDVDALLYANDNFKQSLELFKINNQSFSAFKSWVDNWSVVNDLKLDIKQPVVNPKSKNTSEFKVVSTSILNVDQTFVLRLKPIKNVKFQSGDLIAFRPDINEAARQYSVAKIGDEVVLSIKKHDNGLCSTFLSALKVGDAVTATVEHNKDFHFPKTSKPVILIANGAGIAPFLGMISNNLSQNKLHLFLGLRTKASFNLYKRIINEAMQNDKLTSCNIAYSKENSNRVYVQHLIDEQSLLFSNHLKNKGIIMICGSLTMQKEVLEVLNSITMSELNLSLNTFETMGLIKSDCY